METLTKSCKKIETFRISTSNFDLHEEAQSSLIKIDSKFYQKLFVMIVLFSIILIFPEAPKELETVCNNYNSKDICNVL